MRKKIFLSLLLTLFLSFTSALAQITYPHDKKWEFSFFGGAGVAGEETAVTPISGTDDLRLSTFDYSGGFVLGLRVAENLGQHVGAELEYSFADHGLAMLNVKPDVSRLDVDHYAHSILYSILYYPSPRASKLRPFVGFGGGTTLYQVSGSSKTSGALVGIPLKDSWEFAFGFTGGVKAMINSNWGFRMDVRNIWTGVPGYGLPSIATPTGPGFAADGLMTRWQFGGGISYYWGR